MEVELKGSYFEQVYRMVRRIPRGRVCTYGRIAELTGNPGAVRAVGWALNALRGPETGVPWHRVVNARGCISLRDESDIHLQRKLLEAEGVIFAGNGFIDLRRYGWPRKRKGERAAYPARPPLKAGKLSHSSTES